MRTRCLHNHELTPENIIPYGPNGAWRKCRTCEHDRERGRKREYEGFRQKVTCPKCGDVRECSKRNARRIANGELTGLCDWCRYPNRRPLHGGLRMTEAHEFWLERFSLDDIRVLWQSVSLYLDDPEPLRRAA